MLLIIDLELVSLRLRTVSSNRRYVDQASPILDEGASLDWDINFGQIFQAEVNEFFKFILS